MKPLTDEIARIAESLADEKARALASYARYLSGFPEPPSEIRPTPFPHPAYWGALGIFLAALLTCEIGTLVSAFRDGWSLYLIGGILFPAGGALALLANTLWAQEQAKKLPDSLSLRERNEALKALRWRLWRPLLVCAPILLWTPIAVMRLLR